MRIGRACWGALCALAMISVCSGGARAAETEDTAWVRIYNGPGSGADFAIDVELDAAKNVYVAGSSTGAGSGLDYAVVKYDSNGVMQWVRRYNGPGNAKDTLMAFWLDASANIYVTGGSAGTGGNLDFATVKYDSDGNLLWERRYNGPANANDMAVGLFVDPTGNVYVAGNSQGLGTGADYYTIKYNAAGTVQWEKRYNSFGNQADSARMVVVDATGNVYVSGRSTDAVTSADYLTLKYNAAGLQQWFRRYNGPGNSHDRAYDMALDSQGNVYIVGAVWNGTLKEDYGLIKYRPDGTLAWASTYNGPANQYDAGLVVRLDDADNIYITGRSDGTSPFLDEMTTLRYDTTGALQWDRRYAGAIAGDDAVGLDLFITNEGNIWVGGFSDSVLVDMTAQEYSPAGDELQRRRFFVAHFTIDLAYAITLDDDGFIYMAGSTQPSAAPAQRDFSTVKLKPCACPHQMDGDEDGFLTAVDLNDIINILFFSAPNAQGPACPTYQFDFDCSGEVDALDLNDFIDYLFFSGPGPCAPCTQ